MFVRRASWVLLAGVAVVGALVAAPRGLPGEPPAAAPAASPQSGGAFARALAALATEHYQALKAADRRRWEATLSPALAPAERDAAWARRDACLANWREGDRLTPARMVVGGVAWQGAQPLFGFDGDAVADADGGALWLRSLSCVPAAEATAGPPPPFGYVPDVQGVAALYAAALRQAAGPQGLVGSAWSLSEQGLKGYLGRHALPESSVATLRALDDEGWTEAALPFREAAGGAGGGVIDAVELRFGEVGLLVLAGRSAVGDAAARIALVGGRVYIAAAQPVRMFRRK